MSTRFDKKLGVLPPEYIHASFSSTKREHGYCRIIACMLASILDDIISFACICILYTTYAKEIGRKEDSNRLFQGLILVWLFFYLAGPSRHANIGVLFFWGIFWGQIRFLGFSQGGFDSELVIGEIFCCYCLIFQPRGSVEMALGMFVGWLGGEILSWGCDKAMGRKLGWNERIDGWEGRSDLLFSL